MKTSLIIGTAVAVVGVGAAYKYFKNKADGQQMSKKTFLKKLFESKSQYEIREVDSVSMRTFGSWIKEHDLPSFTGYKIFVIKDQCLLDKKKNPNDLFVYGFCIIDAKFNIIDCCIYLCKEVESSFAARVTNGVNEIVIK